MVTISEFWISLKETLQNLGTISIISIMIIIIILIILMIVEKNLKNKVIIKKDRNKAYFEEIIQIQSPDPVENLKNIDRIARNFFSEKFNVGKSKGYSELTDIFLKQNQKQIAEFCNLMNNFLYSGETISNRQNKTLITALATIITSNPLPQQED